MQNVYVEPPAAPGPPKTSILTTVCAQGAELGVGCVRRGGGIGAPRRWYNLRGTLRAPDALALNNRIVYAEYYTWYST